MPEVKSVTFRDQTTGLINNLMIDEDKACAQSQNLLCYLAGALVSYKDEGVEFAPSVVFCDEIEAFLRAFPGAVFHTIGRATLDPASGPRILKDCAPLSGRNWFIFIERAGDNVIYGIFTYFRLPTAIPLHEGIYLNANLFCVLIRKVSLNTIEMRGAKGSILTLIFSTVRESASHGTPIEKFSAACCSGIFDESIRQGFKAYFARLLEAALTSSHGTILVCGEDLDPNAVPEMQDAVPVLPLLDFKTAFSDFQTADTAGSILNLQRCEELLEGFLRCDGTRPELGLLVRAQAEVR
jgi:hypothetical protein